MYLSLLNKAREITERIIDTLYPHTEFGQKPRTYRRQARKAFLGFGILRLPTSCVHAVVGFGILRLPTSCVHAVVGFGILRRPRSLFQTRLYLPHPWGRTSCVHAVVGFGILRRPKRQSIRKAVKQQLQYVRRNLGHIERLMDCFPTGTALPLSRGLLYRYWVIQHVYAQQWEMYRNKSHRCDDRIVSIHQPYVRPIVRGHAT